MFYRTFGPIYILKSSVPLHFCRSGPTVFGKSDVNITPCYSTHVNFFHLLARKPNLEKCSIYSNKFFHNFHLSKSSFTFPGLRASGLANILPWILTKLGTYLVLKRIWNPIDFQGQKSRSLGKFFRRGDMPCFALPIFLRRT
jgi:hypothetical protein